MTIGSLNSEQNKDTAPAINSATSLFRTAKQKDNWRFLIGNWQVVIFFLLLAGLFSVVFAGCQLGGKGDDASSALASTISRHQVEETFELSGVHPQTRESVRGKVHMTVKEVRKSPSISVQGEPVDLGPNQAFLTIDLELENKNTQQLGFFARDYFRLIKNGKPLAPQFYNEGVNLAPVAVRTDRVAFLITKDDTEFNLQIGDLSAPSETLEIVLEK